MSRTTIKLNDDLMKQARVYAANEKSNLTKVIEEALRRYLPMKIVVNLIEEKKRKSSLTVPILWRGREPSKTQQGSSLKFGY